MEEKSSDGEQTNSKFVNIAYRQSSLISGNNEPTPTEKSTEEPNFQFPTRIKNLPIISGLTSTVSGAYDSLKKSHATVESILTATEEHLQEGAKIMNPVTSTIGNALEEPLKTIDSAICGGIDYLEEKVPQLKDSTVQYSNSIIETVRDTLENLGKADETPGESKEPPNK
ncbi:perilipin-1 [Diachasma alloeum]|uniref:perilipin-1 n=1 Tax=Diachasma alloeum TaxID=454923 RepID=UPI000738406B|nr:perilipin-1 [Diachasma alloeum]